MLHAVGAHENPPEAPLAEKPADPKGHKPGALLLARRDGSRKDDYASPHYQDLLEDVEAEARQELMRLLYVACTRAEHQLLISFSDVRGKGLSDALLRGMEAAAPEMQTLEAADTLGYVSLDTDQAQALAARCTATLHSTDAAVATAAPDCVSAHVRAEGAPRTAPPPKAALPVIQQVSASDIQAFYQCPRKYYLFRLLRLGELADKDPAKAANKGSAIHLLLEWGSTAQAQALFECTSVPEDLGREIVQVVEDFQASRFMADVRAQGDPVKEKAFFVRLSAAGGVPRYLKGYLDLLVWRDDGSLLIVDYKSGASEVSHADYQIQADCYGLAGLEMGAEKVVVTMVRPEVCDGAGEPETFSFEYSGAQCCGLRASLLESIAAMENAQHAGLEQVKLADCKAYCSVYGSLCDGGASKA